MRPNAFVSPPVLRAERPMPPKRRARNVASPLGILNYEGPRRASALVPA